MHAALKLKSITNISFSQQLPKVTQRAKALFNLMFENHSGESALVAFKIVPFCLCLQPKKKGFRFPHGRALSSAVTTLLLTLYLCITLSSRIINFISLITHQLISNGFQCLISLLVFVVRCCTPLVRLPATVVLAM